MELTKTKFKKSEVGTIPEDWNCEKIDLFARITTGDKDTQDRVDDGVYPFFVRSNIIEKINSYSFDGEAVLTSGDGVGVGKIFHYLNCKFDYHQRVYNIYDFRNDVFGKYFFYYFSSHFYDRVMSMTAKSSVDSVRREMIAEMLVPLPPFQEQKAIATALSDVDEMISKLEKLIEKKKAIKQGAMQQLLTPPHKGGKRLEGFSGEWVEKRLGDLIRFQSGYPLSSVFFNQNNVGTRIIKNRDLKSDDAIYFFNSDFPAEYAVENGDVLIGMDGDFLLCLWKKGHSVLNQRVGRLIPTKDVSMIFLFYYLQDFLKNIENRTSSTTVKHLSNNLVENIILPLPSKLEQDSIGNILFDMDKNLEILDIKLSKAIELKQGMMQELLTGRTRLI